MLALNSPLPWFEKMPDDLRFPPLFGWWISGGVESEVLREMDCEGEAQGRASTFEQARADAEATVEQIKIRVGGRWALHYWQRCHGCGQYLGFLGAPGPTLLHDLKMSHILGQRRRQALARGMFVIPQWMLKREYLLPLLGVQRLEGATGEAWGSFAAIRLLVDAVRLSGSGSRRQWWRPDGRAHLELIAQAPQSDSFNSQCEYWLRLMLWAESFVPAQWIATYGLYESSERSGFWGSIEHVHAAKKTQLFLNEGGVL